MKIKNYPFHDTTINGFKKITQTNGENMSQTPEQKKQLMQAEWLKLKLKNILNRYENEDLLRQLLELEIKLGHKSSKINLTNFKKN